MGLTPEEIVKFTLKPGAVYKYSDGEALQNETPHFFIVVNTTPKDDQIILLTCSTSKVDKAKRRAMRRGHASDTLVELDYKEFIFLDVPSIVDCNSVFLRSESFLIKKCEEGFKCIDEISPEKLKELQQAFLKSKVHAKALKRIIDPGI